MDDFIDDSEQPMEDVSFYRKWDPGNIDDYIKFPNQTRDPGVAVYEDDEMFFGSEGMQTELFAPENRENVEFYKFEGYEKSVKKFMDALQNFENSDNPFFDSIVYGLMCKITEENKWIIFQGRVTLEKEKVREVLGKDLYGELMEIKDDIQLDKTLLGFSKYLVS